MTWRDATDRALQSKPEGRATVRVRGEGGAHADVDVREAGPIGVRVGRVRVHHGDDRDVRVEADRLSRGLRALPHRVVPVEVDPTLGGGVLRSAPDELGDRDHYEVRIDGPRDVEVRRYQVGADGAREASDWDLTRDQLGRLLDQLDGH